ncbi:MAG: 5-methylcytosine-specific restriction endonuclease system specificity protein McrC [Methanobrevibacter sp.]|nr:5-methylcytosine-specific restriction endonuclease system specificity protein McrC [Methanobrevibacter sp.]
MLSYAFHVLKDEGYRKVAAEDFENTAELFSEILILALNKQIKQGLYKDYIEINETTSSIRGKINITESINSQSFIKRQLNCTYDEFSINSYLNKIIKTTIFYLLKSDIDRKNEKNLKKRLRKILLYFSDVDTLDVHNINWKIRYDRNNQTYRMIINLCYLTLNGLLQQENDGSYKLMQFLDDQRMSKLYEKFLLNYYDKEHKDINVSSPQVQWQLDSDFSDMLPKMQTDVTLSYGGKILIIDAKYYSKTTQSYFDSNTIHSNNLYQIFTYVKNKSYEVNDEVAGLLLYARTRDKVQPDCVYRMSGNKISVKTLDLNTDFSIIKEQLDKIVYDYFMDSSVDKL